MMGKTITNRLYKVKNNLFDIRAFYNKYMKGTENQTDKFPSVVLNFFKNKHLSHICFEFCLNYNRTKWVYSNCDAWYYNIIQSDTKVIEFKAGKLNMKEIDV